MAKTRKNIYINIKLWKRLEVISKQETLRRKKYGKARCTISELIEKACSNVYEDQLELAIKKHEEAYHNLEHWKKRIKQIQEKRKE